MREAVGAVGTVNTSLISGLAGLNLSRGYTRTSDITAVGRWHARASCNEDTANKNGESSKFEPDWRQRATRVSSE